MTRETKVAAIPDIREDNVLDVLRSIKATMEVREGAIGDPLDQGATLRNLADLNLATTDGTTTTATGATLPISAVIPKLPDGYDPAKDYTTPPAPTNLVAKGGLTNVYLSWDGAPYRNHNYTEVWRYEADNIGSAVLIGTTAASVYADPAQEDTTYYYWIRFVSKANITGPYNATSGTVAKTALRVSTAIEVLTAELQQSQLFVDLGTRIKSVEDYSLLSKEQVTFLTDARARIEQQLSQNGSAILQTQNVSAKTATLFTALASQFNDPVTGLARTRADLTSLYYTKVDADSAIAGSVNTVKARLNNFGSTGVSLESAYSVQADAVAGLSGQYSVKIDNNGHVTGFGLASTATNGTPTSAFIVRADKFAIAGTNDTLNQLGTTNPTRTPFMVNTTPVVKNGKTYPSGVYIDSAFIAEATIDSAQISSITADQITTGTLTATISMQTGMLYGGVNPSYSFGSNNFGTGFYLGVDGGTHKFYVGNPTQNMQWTGSSLSVTGNINATSGSFRNVNIYNDQNQIVFSSGGLTPQALANAGLKALAYKDGINAYNDITGLGSYAFLTKLSQANVSTYIEVGAISQAYIGNLDASKITSGTISAGLIDTSSLTISRLSSSAQMTVTNTYIKITDPYGNLRVQIGDLYA
jgi:hypothetical protein